MKISGKAVATFFYKPGLEEHSWICNKCHKQRRSPKGYTNLINHAKTCCGANFEQEAVDHLTKHGYHVREDGRIIGGEINQRVIDSFYLSNAKEKRAYQWIKWIACRNQAVSEVENKLTRDLAKVQGMSRKTLRKYIVATAAETVPAISKALKDSGAYTLLFDGWSCDGASTHYVGIFAGYIDSNGAYDEVLLAMQPTLDEEDLGADSHVELIESTMELYQLEEERLVCLVGDNCSTNKAIANKMEVPLVGCGNHKLNLAVNEWIEGQPGLREAIDTISTLMSKASTLKNAARLRDLTMERFGRHYSAKKGNEIRWTSDFGMTERYWKIDRDLRQISSLDKYQPSASQVRTLKNAHEHFQLFQSVAAELQACGMDLAHQREQFDTLLADPEYSAMKKHLTADADIVHSPLFESGVIKIAKGEALTAEEAEACDRLRRKLNKTPEEVNEEVWGEPSSTLQRLQLNRKKRKLESSGNTHTIEYYDAGKLVCATSNCCERLFSEAKYIMVPHRRGMSPLLFESLLFLKKNVKFWSVKTVAVAMKRADMDNENDETAADPIFERDCDEFYE